MPGSLTYSALASVPTVRALHPPGVGTLELTERQEEGLGREAQGTTARSWLHCSPRQARLGSAFACAAVLTALAVLGVGAAGGAWRRAIEARGPRAFTQAFTTIGHCEAPQADSQCARDIEYAMSHIKKHPSWYVNLHANDNPKAFQWFLHKQRTSGGTKRRCPAPCDWNVESPSETASLYFGKCHTSVSGEDCYNHVVYTMKENLPNHPEWYPGLSEGSSFKIVQQYLHHQGVCPKPCGLKEELRKAAEKKKKDKKDEETLDGLPCHTAQAGEACYGDVLFAMDKLKEGMHNEWYDGKLDEDSSFEQVQAYLSLQHTSDADHLCPTPCSQEAIDNITKMGDEKCHTAQEGDECWKAAVWVVEHGVKEKPQWYKHDNISRASTFEMVQTRLSKEKDEDRACKTPACPCKTAKKGDDCWKAIQWVFDVGLKNHSKWYADLPKKPTYQQVQMHLHKDKHTKCRLPCIFAPWWDEPGKKKETETERL